jgi:hypothetical protein
MVWILVMAWILVMDGSWPLSPAANVPKHGLEIRPGMLTMHRMVNVPIDQQRAPGGTLAGHRVRPGPKSGARP